MLATLVTKRDKFHSNVIASPVNLFRNSVRERLAELTSYFLAHGVSDPAAAQQKAIVALGNIVRKQALIMGYADTFAALALLLALTAATLLFTRRAGANGAAAHCAAGLFRQVRICAAVTSSKSSEVRGGLLGLMFPFGNGPTGRSTVNNES